MKILLLALLLISTHEVLAQVDQQGVKSRDSGPVTSPDQPSDTSGSTTFGSFLERYSLVGKSLYRHVGRKMVQLEKLADLSFEVRGADLGYSRGERVILLWTGASSYRCFVETGAIEPVPSFGLMGKFLARPIVSVSGERLVSGCGGKSVTMKNHEASSRSLPSLRHEITTREKRLQDELMFNGVSTLEISRVLRGVNLDPESVPTLADFDINHRDLRLYEKEILEAVEKDRAHQRAWAAYRSDSSLEARPIRTWTAVEDPSIKTADTYLNLLRWYDTVSADVVRAALVKDRLSYLATGSTTLSVLLVNDVGDTLRCTSRSAIHFAPYALPWTIHVAGESYQTYSVELARLLIRLLPERKVDLDLENARLLRVVGAYLALQQR